MRGSLPDELIEDKTHLKTNVFRYADLDLDLQTSEFKYLCKIWWGIRLFSPQDSIFESRSSLLGKSYPLQIDCLITESV